MRTVSTRSLRSLLEETAARSRKRVIGWQMTRSRNNRWLHRFTVLTAVATLFLICVGGLVTSHGVGMSVPDWPTTYGYNMFFFPLSRWFGTHAGGIFYEHSHRLVASGVGLLTVILAVWLYLKEERRWLQWLGFVAVFAVVLQGVLGGLRVTQLKDEIGIFHAALAQLFFVLLCAIALFTSRWWQTAARFDIGKGLRSLYWFGTALVLFQLILGATMRHQHAGLAIPDFPLAYGKFWPAMDEPSVAYYNQMRMETRVLNPITAFQIGLQMLHRLTALAVFVVIIWAARLSQRRLGWNASLTKLSLIWVGLVFSQMALGAATIWTNKSADIATAHVAVGALTLLVGTMLLLAAYRCQARLPASVPMALPTPQRPGSQPMELPA